MNKRTALLALVNISVGEFAVHDAQQVSHLGDGRLVFSQLTNLQPVL